MKKLSGQADEDRRPRGRKLSQTNFQTGEQEATRSTSMSQFNNSIFKEIRCNVSAWPASPNGQLKPTAKDSLQ